MNAYHGAPFLYRHQVARAKRGLITLDELQRCGEPPKGGLYTGLSSRSRVMLGAEEASEFASRQFMRYVARLKMFNSIMVCWIYLTLVMVW
jgi:hypothetical protein